MLSFFRSNQFFVAIPLAVYAFLVHLGALLGTVRPSPNPVEGGLLYVSCFGWIAEQPFYSSVSALVLVILQAITVNLLADEFRLMGDRNWFPGLFYVLCASALPDFLFLSAPLVAATFIPVSLWRIFNAYQKQNVPAAIFDGAFWISVASLFYPPALWLLLAAFAGYEVVRVFRLSERFIFLIGALVPLFLVWLGYFWLDRGAEFRQAHFSNLFQLYPFDAVWDTILVLKTALFVLLTFVFLLGLGSFYSRKGIQAQKFVSVLYWFLAISALSVLFRPAWHWEHLVLPAAAMAVLLALSLQGLRQRFWAETWHWTLLGFVIFIQYADFFLGLTGSLF